jgi:CHASE1-domain containing sensor protein/signal transduction histidine kinase
MGTGRGGPWLRPAAWVLARAETFAWATLVVTVLLTLLGWEMADHEARLVARQRFDDELDAAVSTMTGRMDEYVNALRGGVAFHAASSEVTRADWHDYITASRIETLYPGIQGVGYAVWVAPAQQAAVEARAREEGHRGFVVHPRSDGPAACILYLEPQNERNQRALGYDMWSEATRRAAMERARDTGDAALSGRVTLVQETTRDVQRGVLLYMPVYTRGMPTSSVAQRRLALAGFVYAPFRVRDLLVQVLLPHVHALELEVYDGRVRSAGALLHATSDGAGRTARYEGARTLTIAGRAWTIAARSTPAFERAQDRLHPAVIAGATLMADALLFGVLLLLGRQHRHAHASAQALRHLSESLERRVEERTTALRESREEALRASRMDALVAETASAMAGAGPLAALLQQVADVVLRQLRVTAVRVWTSDGPGSTLRQEAAAGVSIPLGSTTVPVERSRLAAVVRDGLPLHVADISRETAWTRLAWARDPRVRVLVCLPLRVEDCVLGALAVFAPEALGESERAALGRVAQVLALGIERARAGASERAATAAAALTRELEARVAARTAELEATLSEQGSIAYAITHNLRAPLRAIHGHVAMLREAGPANATGSPHLDAIARNAVTLAAQIDDLVRFTVLYRQPVRKELTSAVSAVEGALQELEGAWSGRNVVVAREELPPCVANPELLQEVFRNLLSNAFKFTRRVDAPRVEIGGRVEDAAGGGRQVRYWVRDNGIGFDVRFREAIFGLFHRMHASSEYEGTGCGLALARRIVERHGGRIWADSTPGRGATFTFTLPEPEDA